MFYSLPRIVVIFGFTKEQKITPMLIFCFPAKSEIFKGHRDRGGEILEILPDRTNVNAGYSPKLPTRAFV